MKNDTKKYESGIWLIVLVALAISVVLPPAHSYLVGSDFDLLTLWEIDGEENNTNGEQESEQDLDENPNLISHWTYDFKVAQSILQQFHPFLLNYNGNYMSVAHPPPKWLKS